MTMDRRTLFKRMTAVGLALALPRELVAPELHERARSYFFGGLAVVDDTPRVQAFLNAGGGTVPSEWGTPLTIRGPLYMPHGSVLRGGHFRAVDGLLINGQDFVIENNRFDVSGSRSAMLTIHKDARGGRFTNLLFARPEGSLETGGVLWIGP